VQPGNHAREAPDRPAVVMAGSGETLTYAELADRSARVARLLVDRGLAPGERVALFAENGLRTLEVVWGALRAGLYLVPVNRSSVAGELAYVLDDCEASALLATASGATVAAEAVAAASVDPLMFVIGGPAEGFEPYDELIDRIPADPDLPPRPRGEALLYSSGTTGRPKGVLRPMGEQSADDAELGHAAVLLGGLGLGPGEVYLTPAPLHHAAPLRWSVAAHEVGATVVIMERFDERGFLAAVERHWVTHAQVVPTMLVRLLRLPEHERAAFDLSSLHAVVHAAAPCPIEVKRQAIDWLGPIVHEYYAGTEVMGLTFITADQWLDHPGSVGRAVIGIVHICDETGAELPPGDDGLVYFERDQLPFEYLGAPDATRRAQHPHHPGWSTLGDVGHVDEDGWLYLTDRKAFLIITGGVNVAPAEVEGCLVVHPAVADVAVFGVPDDEMGERVHAVVQPLEGVEAGPELAEQLRGYAREHLASFKVPRTIEFRAELPRQATGKLAKHLLRAEHLERDGA
jgi:long-chain acyl-CoA synthetase